MRAMCHRRETLTTTQVKNPMRLALAQTTRQDTEPLAGEKHPRPSFTHCPKMPQDEDMNKRLG